MALFCFTQPRKQLWRESSRPPQEALRVTNALLFEYEMGKAFRDQRAVIVCYTADWCSLHQQTVTFFNELAGDNSEAALFLLCDPDSMPDVAREFAVHDLPSFHIFVGGSLVERLSGLRSLEYITPLLDHYARLSEPDTSISSLSSGYSPAYTPRGLHIIDVPKSPQQTASTSSLDGSNDSCMSVTGLSAGAVLERRCSGVSNASTPRSYMPQYVQKQLNGKGSRHSRSDSWQCPYTRCSSSPTASSSPQVSSPKMRQCFSLNHSRQSHAIDRGL